MCSVRSNAFEASKNTTCTDEPWVTNYEAVYFNKNVHWSVLCPALKPNWFSAVPRNGEILNDMRCSLETFLTELFYKIVYISFQVSSDSVTRVNDSTQVTIFGDSYSTWVTLRKIVARLESHFSQNDSTRVTVNDSRLESESFLQNLWVTDGQIQFVCTQRNEHFLLQWWSIIGRNFLFFLSSRVRFTLRIKFPQLA